MWLTGNLQIWLYGVPIDMRKSIDGLSIIVSEQLEKNFYSIKEKMTSGDFKEEFEDEMDSITI